MKISYLILCHKNPEQVAALIRQLNAENVDFFVHVDKRNNAFELSSLPNVYAVSDDERIEVTWGCFSIVEATLKMIDLMLATGTYDYVFLISGQCFPIKSNEDIVKFLEAGNGDNYIEVKSHSSKWDKVMLKRNELYYPRFLQQRTFFSQALKNVYIFLTGGKSHTFRFLRRQAPRGFTNEFGSTWWALTYECVSWMRSYLNENPRYVEFFKHALVPDESLFQTLFMASPYRKDNARNLTYLTWADNGNHPTVFKCEDIPTLMERGELFARKFDMSVDSEVIDRLSEML